MDEKEILALEDRRFAAMVARDFKALEGMLHGDLLYTHSSGVRAGSSSPGSRPRSRLERGFQGGGVRVCGRADDKPAQR
jgi:hypothetical protein